ncbi:MAG: glycosyltransferase family 2 protein [Methylococcales bacterium]|nr:glycosyltransferase family 2 protein [Methylococcales bacterium]
MKLSIVTTLYYSEPYLDEFYRRIIISVQKITSDYELIYVNDGSPDQVLNLALEQQKNDSKITLIDLSRNFGHHQAGMIGLNQATGDSIFLIDCDLEEAPELLEKFWTEYSKNNHIDVFFGVQASRKGKWFERHSGSLFYSLFNKLSTVKMPANMLTVRLMSKRFVTALLEYQEKNLFLGGLMCHAGFEQQAITVKKSSKPTSSYTLTKLLSLFTTSIVSFSSKPLEFILYLGFLLIGLSSLTTMFLLCNIIFSFTDTASDLQLILLSICFLSGIIISCTGILGIYLAKIYDEVKQRPRAIIKKVYHSK